VFDFALYSTMKADTICGRLVSSDLSFNRRGASKSVARAALHVCLPWIGKSLHVLHIFNFNDAHKKHPIYIMQFWGTKPNFPKTDDNARNITITGCHPST